MGALSTATTSATALSNLILVSPQKTIGYQPQNGAVSPGTAPVPQPPALLFHYEGEQTALLESDITDHYSEANLPFQDQIALKPVIISTRGFIGELNDVPPNAILAALQLIANKLTIIGAYTPALSTTALLAYNEAFQLYQVGANAVNSAIAAWSSLSGGGGENVIGSNGLGSAFNPTTGKVTNNQNLQQTAFQQFFGYWNARTLFTVQTPWAVLQNMAILRLRAVQDEETNVITGFEISFKQIRVANTSATPVSVQGRLGTQSAGVTDLGTSTPTPSLSLSSGLTGSGLA